MLVGTARRQFAARFLMIGLWLAGLSVVLYALLLFINEDHSANSNIYLVLARAAGLLAMYGVFWQLLLMSRLGFMEAGFSYGKLQFLHRINGIVALLCMAVHAVGMLVGYVIKNDLNLIRQLLEFLLQWDDVLVAAFGLVLFCVIALVSVSFIRKRLGYEWWYRIHLSTYLAVGLVMSHQFSQGQLLISSTMFNTFWLCLYLIAFGCIVTYRILRPVCRFQKYQFRVAKVVHETPGVVSIYIEGRGLENYRYSGGQFAFWRFLTPDLWLESHPFSFSSAPGGRYLRVTVKSLGDYTNRLMTLKPGSRVLVDGPHGNFSVPDTRLPGVFIAGGIGIAPIIAMLESIPSSAAAPTVVYVAKKQQDLVLLDELERLVRIRGGSVYTLTDDSHEPSSRIDNDLLAEIIPHYRTCYFMLCGPITMMKDVRKELREMGVNPGCIKQEIDRPF